jgi:hypothetical protein
LTKTKVQWKRIKSSGEESANFTDLSLQVALGRVPSLPISLYRSPFAGAKFTDLPLKIPPYWQMAKKVFMIRYVILCTKNIFYMYKTVYPTLAKFAKFAKYAKFTQHLPNSPLASLASPPKTVW